MASIRPWCPCQIIPGSFLPRRNMLIRRAMSGRGKLIRRAHLMLSGTLCRRPLTNRVTTVTGNLLGRIIRIATDQAVAWAALNPLTKHISRATLARGAQLSAMHAAVRPTPIKLFRRLTSCEIGGLRIIDPLYPAVLIHGILFRRRPGFISRGFGIGRRLLCPHRGAGGRCREENDRDQNADMKSHGDVSRHITA